MSSAPLALTLGEPAGIGPEITAGAWRALRRTGPAFFAIGDAAVIASAGVEVARIDDPSEAAERFADALPTLDMPLARRPAPGQPLADAAAQVVAWIECAVALTLGGAASAVVTGPVAKATLRQGGFAFPGHTELLGSLTAKAAMAGARGPVMLLTAAGLRAALVTVHEPLARVPALITTQAIVHAGTVLAQALGRDFGVEDRRIAVAALNPHAGESGTLGREEIEVIAPAVRRLREAGIAAFGPAPADSLFHEAARATYDAALCLYHDQALIPVKMLDFWGGVNVTLGLPIVRTSPDHGVAFDIAGRGLARPDSLIAALGLAAQITRRRAAAATAR